jgi:hypothetical protein
MLQFAVLKRTIWSIYRGCRQSLIELFEAAVDVVNGTMKY